MYYTQSADAWQTFATEIFEKIKDKMSGAITNIALSYAASTSRTEAQQAAKTTTKFTGSGLTTMQYVTGGASATNDGTTLTVTTGDTSGTMTMKFYDNNGNRLTLSKGQRIEIVFHGEFDPTKAAAITGGDEVTGLAVTATAATVTIAATMARAYGNTALTIPAGTTLKITAAEFSQINDSTDITWIDTVPAMTDEAPYLWAKITATLSDGSTKEIAKVCYESLSATSGGTSPTAAVTKTDTGATITITDKNGTTTADITNGTNGKDGKDGANGKDGADGKDGAVCTGINHYYALSSTDTGFKTVSIAAKSATPSACTAEYTDSSNPLTVKQVQGTQRGTSGYGQLVITLDTTIPAGSAIRVKASGTVEQYKSFTPYISTFTGLDIDLNNTFSVDVQKTVGSDTTSIAIATAGGTINFTSPIEVSYSKEAADWQTIPPVMTAEKPYLWTYEEHIFSNGGNFTSPPAVIGIRS